MQNIITNPKNNYPETLGDIYSNAAKTAAERLERMHLLPYSPENAKKLNAAISMRDSINEKWLNYINSITD